MIIQKIKSTSPTFNVNGLSQLVLNCLKAEENNITNWNYIDHQAFLEYKDLEPLINVVLNSLDQGIDFTIYGNRILIVKVVGDSVVILN